MAVRKAERLGPPRPTDEGLVATDGVNLMASDQLLQPAPAMGAGAVTKTEHAYAWIRNQILSGAFEPGRALDQETLASDLGVSTTPLREALRRLESEQLVINRAHRDTIVSPIARETLEEAFAVRLEVEPLGTRLATMHATEAELADIVKYSESRPADNDPLTLLQYNGNIHRGIYRASHNSVLIRVLDSLSDLIDRYRAMTFRRDGAAAAAHRNHARILEAMVEREPELAASLMREHVAFGFERMREAHRDFDANQVG